MNNKSNHSRMFLLGISLAIGAAISGGIIQNRNNIVETHAATTYSATIGEKVWSAYGSQTLSGVSWTAAATGGSYWGYDATKGQQFGSSGSPATSLTLRTSGISGTISSITISTSGASSVAATIGVSVGGNAYGGAAKSITSSNAPYTFAGAAAGEIVFTWTQTSSKALYLKSISVDYSSKTLSTIAVSGTLSKTSYYDGESFSSNGLTITANYSDSSNANVTANCTFTPNPLTTGTTSVTASYTEGRVTKTASISGITVAARTLTAISVLTNPTKMSYLIGQSFSPTGMKIRASYNVGVTNDDYIAYSYLPTFAFDSLGSKTITITSTENASISTALSVAVIDSVEGTDTITAEPSVTYFDPKGVVADLLPKLVIGKSDENLEDFVITSIDNFRIAATAKIEYEIANAHTLTLGGNDTTGGEMRISPADGLYATEVKYNGIQVISPTTFKTNEVANNAVKGTNVSAKIYENDIIISSKVSNTRIWFDSIEIVAKKASNCALDYGAHFLASTADECTAKNVTSATWNTLKSLYDNADTSIQSIIKSASANVSGSDLEKATARYTFIANKYEYDDYLDLGIAPHSNQIINDIQNQNSMIYIIAISFVGISVLIGYRLMRKKSEKTA